MASKEPVVIRAMLTTATPDRTQYKPYAPVLEFEGVYVDIPVSADLATLEKGGKIILSVDGLAVMLDVVATGLERMNARWSLSKQTPTKPYNPNSIN